MKKSIVQPYIEHVRFLGCDVRVSENVFVVFRGKECLFAFTLEGKKGILMRNFYDLSDYAEKNMAETYKYVDELNNGSNIVRFLINHNDSKKSLNHLYWFPAEKYDKEAFGLIFAFWLNDTVENIRNHPDTAKFLD